MAGTIADIAKKAGVSRGTVDRVLNKRGRVAPEVTKRVEEVVAEIGYVPKRIIRRNKLPKIGVVTQLSKSSFMAHIRTGIEQAKKDLEARGATVLIKECERVDEQEQMAALLHLEKQGIAGLAIMPVESEQIRNKLNELIEQGIPVVTFNSDIVGTGRSCFVGLDNAKSGRTAAGLMAMMLQEQGKVLAITGHFGNNATLKRVSGLVEELRESYPQMELVGVQSSFDNADEVEKIVLNTLSGYKELGGIIIFSGGQGGVTRALEKAKLPKRPYVIFFDSTIKNEKALREGKVDFIIDQDGYTQGNRSLNLLGALILEKREPKKDCFYTDIRIKTKQSS